MRIRVLGAGFYGLHISQALIEDGHDVEIHEIASHIFAGASGGIPARLHQGFHYPRSRMTRAACHEHSDAFMARYGFLTKGVPVNLYAIAADRSLVDFEQYVQTLAGEVEFIKVHDPAEFGLRNVEGALLTGERHIVTDKAKEHFEKLLGQYVHFNTAPGEVDSANWDVTIDATFCANDSAGVDRYEPCLVVLLEGPTEKAVTIMDGPFASLYPWNEDLGLCSLSSALWSPISKECKTWIEAKKILDALTYNEISDRANAMIGSMATYYPAVERYSIAECKTSIRAMPLSGADTRLVDVVKVGERALRVRAGKIDAIIHAEKLIKEMLPT